MAGNCLWSDLGRTFVQEVIRRVPPSVTVIHCELPASSYSSDCVVATTPGFKVDYHVDNDLKAKHIAPIKTPNILPDKLSPPSLVHLMKKEEIQNSKIWTAATPCPSNWPMDCAVVQRNANAPVEDRAVIMPLKVDKIFVDESVTTAPQAPATVAATNTGSKSASSAKKPRHTWILAGVFDGHGGWQTSEFVSRVLPQRIHDAINKLPGSTLTAKSLTDLLRQCFMNVDGELRAAVEPAFNLGHCRVTRPGSTCCLIMATPAKLVAMNVGDSKAVLCRRGKAISLTETQNAGNPAEAKKLQALHPNEPDIVYIREPKAESDSAESKKDEKAQSAAFAVLDHLKSVMSLWPMGCSSHIEPPAAYVKARLQPTRSFGDFDLKDAKFAVYWGEGRTSVKQPYSHPYITAEPEVTVIPRDLDNDEFVIVATDGLWDEFTPHEAVAEVRKALAAGKSLLEAAHALELGVLQKAATREEKTVNELLELSPKERRKLFDDVTVTIVALRPTKGTPGAKK